MTTAQLPDYPQNVPDRAVVETALAVLDAKLKEEGHPVGANGNCLEGALAVTTRKTIYAQFAAHDVYYRQHQGGTKGKTSKQREAEAYLYRALCRLLADWPDQPFGMTEYAVSTALYFAIDEAADMVVVAAR